VTRLTETEAHIGSMTELLGIVGAMRSLAGMHLQDAQRVLPGIRRHAETAAAAIADTLLLIGGAPAQEEDRQVPGALIMCMSEHGFVGGFNEKMVEAAEQVLSGFEILLVLGSRGAGHALEKGLKTAWWTAMATRSSGVTGTIEELSTEIYRRLAAGEIGRVEIMFSRYEQGIVSTIERQKVLPFDESMIRAGPFRQPPLHNLDPMTLHEKLVAEYVFARLAEAAIESIASENAARFATMGSAHDNVSRKVEDLRKEAHLARQAEVTIELLDLVTAEAALGDQLP
jgi:F-type H+-transporting ATPase subunit gamma